MATANQFVDWGTGVHNPPWQANDTIPIQEGVTTVFDLLKEVQPALDPQSQGSGPNLFVTALGGVVDNAAGNGYWWVAFVNGQPLKVSCAVTTLKDGDSVAWDYVHSMSGLSQPSRPGLS